MNNTRCTDIDTKLYTKVMYTGRCQIKTETISNMIWTCFTTKHFTVSYNTHHQVSGFYSCSITAEHKPCKPVIISESYLSNIIKYIPCNYNESKAHAIIQRVFYNETWAISPYCKSVIIVTSNINILSGNIFKCVSCIWYSV